MRPMIALLLRLYPARWRARYGDEFEALLAERPLGPFDVADVLLGALDAHLHLRGLGSWSEHRRGFPHVASHRRDRRRARRRPLPRRLIWSGSTRRIRTSASGSSSRVGSPLLVGLAGLSAFQARDPPALVWAAFCSAGRRRRAHDARPVRHGRCSPIGRSSAGLVGLELLLPRACWPPCRVAPVRGRDLPDAGPPALRGAVLAIASGIAPPLVRSAPWAWAERLQPVFVAGFLAFPVGWVVLGLQAIRIDRPAMAMGAA